MPQQQYLSTDPNAGTPVASKPSANYLSTDPNAGTPNAPAPQAPRTWGDTARDVGAGILKGAAHGVIDVGQAIVSGGLAPTPWNTNAQTLDAMRAATPYTNTAQKVGGAIETAAELAPAAVGAVGAVRAVPGMAAKLAKSLGPDAPGITPELVKFVLGGRSATAQRLLEKVSQIGAASPNAGGRLVQGSEPTLNDVIGGVLDELRAPAPAKVGTLPPQPSLPPGYTPRSTVPQVASPSGMASMQAAAPIPAPQAATAAPVASVPAPVAAPVAAPPRPYFLKPDAPWPPVTAPSASGPIELPQSLQQFAKPASFPPKDIEGSRLAVVLDQELAKRGLQASDMIPDVMRSKDFTADTRTKVVSALEKVARKQAGVSVPNMTYPDSWQTWIQK